MITARLVARGEKRPTSLSQNIPNPRARQLSRIETSAGSRLLLDAKPRLLAAFAPRDTENVYNIALTLTYTFFTSEGFLEPCTKIMIERILIVRFFVYVDVHCAVHKDIECVSKRSIAVTQ